MVICGCGGEAGRNYGSSGGNGPAGGSVPSWYPAVWITNRTEGCLGIAKFRLEDGHRLEGTNIVYAVYWKDSLAGPLPSPALLVLTPTGDGMAKVLGRDAKFGILPDTVANRALLAADPSLSRFATNRASWLSKQEAIGLATERVQPSPAVKSKARVRRDLFGWEVYFPHEERRDGILVGSDCWVVVRDDKTILAVQRGL